MKKFLVLFLVLFSVNLFYAHAPSEIKIEYDDAKKMIMTNIIHSLKTSPVQDPKKHFIKYIILKVDGKIIDKKSYNEQETIEGQKAVFKVNDIKKGSKIKIDTVCNIGGRKSYNIIVK